MKAVQSGIALKVFVADDADKHVVEPLRDLCLAHSVAVERVASMRELGDLCGIEVGAASAAVLEQSVDS
jgi:large subunit ribosomal protein L7A